MEPAHSSHRIASHLAAPSPPQPSSPPKSTSNTQAYARLSDTFASHRTQALEYRLYNLKQLAYLLTDNEAKIQASIKADLGKSGFDVLVGDVRIVQLQGVGHGAEDARSGPSWAKSTSRSSASPSGCATTRLPAMRPPCSSFPVSSAI